MIPTRLQYDKLGTDILKLPLRCGLAIMRVLNVQLVSELQSLLKLSVKFCRAKCCEVLPWNPNQLLLRALDKQITLTGNKEICLPFNTATRNQ